MVDRHYARRAEDAYIHIIAGGQVSVDYNVFVNSIGVSAGSDLDVGNSALLYATNGTKLSSAVTSSVGSGNDGLIDIETKAVFWAGNEIANRGTIELGDPINGLGAGKLTVLSALRIDGGGTIQLGAKQTNSAFYGAGQIEGVPVGNFNTITGAVTNVDNTITGGGLIKLDSLDNQAGGTIASSQINAAALQIDAVTFTNEGSLVADDNSTLEIGEAGASRTLTNSGSITIGTGSFATLAVTGTLTIAGSGQLILDGADNSLIMGAGTSALNTLINHSEIDAVASADIGFVYANNSTYLFLQNRGSILASSPGAVLTLNTGNYTVDSEGGLLSAYGGGTLVLSSEVDVGNNGELEAGAGGTVDVFQEVVSAVNKGQVVVQAGGVMNIENNGEDYAPIDVYAASGVHPGGMLTLQTGGVILGSIDFHGGGEFDDQSTNAFDFFVSGTGGAIHFGSTGNSVTFTNASGAADSVYGSKETLDLDGASVVAVGDGDAITLEAGTKNALTIQGVGDTIEFLGVSYAATDYVTFVGNGLRTGGTVTVDNSSGVAIDSFAVIGDYEPSQFRLSDDGGNLEVVGAAGLSRPTAYDFNGDGDADILWRDPTTGVDSIWDLTHSGGRIAVNPGTVPANSVVAGIGDFNNDGIADILWRNTTTGADSIWDMTPSGGHTTVNPGTVATSYAVAGVGDFNGDGIADILWRNTSTGADSLWDMTASGGRTAVNPGTVATAYVVAGVGDFNNDGIADILWRNTTTGADAIWDMNASGGHTAVNPGTVATSYVIAGVGDFNNDGIEDLLWRNTTTGADSIWDMTASGGHTAINPGTVSTSYQVAGVGDFNGDGIADILWRNSSTGANTIWEYERGWRAYCDQSRNGREQLDRGELRRAPRRRSHSVACAERTAAEPPPEGRRVLERAPRPSRFLERFPESNLDQARRPSAGIAKLRRYRHPAEFLANDRDRLVDRDDLIKPISGGQHLVKELVQGAELLHRE